MREGEFHVEDLPTECTAILLWRSTYRRNIVVAANRSDCAKVLEWFNKAWEPGVTIYDVVDSGPYGTLDMRMANKNQGSVNYPLWS